MKIKYQTPLIILLVTLFSAGIASYFDYSFNEDLIENAQMKELRKVSTFIQNEIIRQSQKAIAQASLIAHEPWVKKAMKEQNRQLLEESLIPPFQIQKKKYGVIAANFWNPPAKAFLRLFDPENYGDDESTTRSLILATNLQQEAKRGVEVSKDGIAMRGAVTIKDGTDFLGCFEVAISFTEFLQVVKRDLRFDIGIFVDNTLLTAIATELPPAEANQIIAGFRLVDTTDIDLIRSVATPDLLTSINDVIYKTGKKEGLDYGMTMIPLLDFKGVQIGSIVAARSFKDFTMDLEANVRNSYMFNIFQAIILAVLAFLNFYYWIIRPLEKLNDRLKRIEDGQIDDGKMPYTHREDAIGKLAISLTKIKKYLAEQKNKTP